HIQHNFAASTSLEYVAMQIPGIDLTGILGPDTAAPLMRALDRQRGLSPAVGQRPACRTVQSLGRQMMLCPLQGNLREMYLFGKAMELLSTVVASVGPTSTASVTKMSTRDLERIYAAREIVLGNLQAPPSLPQL